MIRLRKLTDEDLDNINPRFLPLPWLVVIVLVVAFLTFKYTGGEDSPNQTQEAQKIFPQIFVTDVEMEQFDDKGQLHYQLKTPLVRHFQLEEKASPKDYTLFETPVFVLTDDPAKPAWFVTAEEGRRDNKGEWFTLSRNVLARQNSPTQGELTFNTEELRLNAHEQYAETNKTVTMRGAGSQMTSQGMRADIKRDHIELVSQVKGTYVP